MRESFHPISVFAREPYSRIIAYPNPTKRNVTSRLAELKRLGISGVSFQGSTRIENLCILGKGYAGVVVMAKKGGKRYALKIRRVDSQREGMKKEAEMLKLANGTGVGPKLVSASRNFLVMEYLGGARIDGWFAEAGDAKRAKSIAKKVLRDCYKLDRIPLDHGELSRISKHVIIGRKTTIIDFESSSIKRRAANVTAATQGIFIGSGISKKMGKLYRLPRKERIISILRIYKGDPCRENFDNILKTLRL